MIEVKNLSYSYSKEDHALSDISFKIEDHEWVSIIGHNGSGKSTISKLLVGLLDPNKGTISYDGKVLNDENVDYIRSKVGIVFQNPDNQFVGVNVKYDVAFGLENHQVEREKMKELIYTYLSKVGMIDYLDREPSTLSGGQKQRVAIAGILAMNCDIIILDEATSMLDPEGSKDIINLIKDLKNTYKKTIITITHDLSLANLSDRVMVLKNGRIIGNGKPEEIFKQRDLLLSSNLDMPFGLKMFTCASEDSVLKNNKELMEALWEFHLKN